MTTNAEQAPKVRTSVLKKSIRRTVNTGQYETLVIEDGFEEIIEWATLEERQRKVDNWDRILVERYKVSHDKILDELGFSAKKAYFKNFTGETVQKFKDIQENNSAAKSSKPNVDTMDTV